MDEPPDASVWLDPHGHVLRVKAADAGVRERLHPMALNGPFWDELSKLDESRVRKALAQSRELGQVVRTTFYVPHAGITTRWEGWILPFFHGRQLMVLRDLTKRRSLHDAERPATHDHAQFVGGLVHDLNHLLTTIVHNLGVARSFTLQDDLWWVNGDPGQLRKVLQRLLINGQQRMPLGGQLHIQTNNVSLTEVRNSLPPGDYVRIAITDPGTRFPEWSRNPIFTPYVTTKDEGSGIGLPSSLSVLPSHGGLLEVAPYAPAGAGFVCWIPAASPQPELFTGAAPRRTNIPSHVLVMDHDQLVCRTITRSLRRLGIQVSTTHSGDEAIAFVEQLHRNKAQIDVAILELAVPGQLAEFDCLPQLLRLDPTLVAIASSGYPNGPVQEKPAKFGFYGVLPKPYTTEFLIQAVQGALDEAHSR